MGRFMGIRPDRTTPTKLPVTFQYIRVGIGNPSPYFIPARFISSPFPLRSVFSGPHQSHPKIFYKNIPLPDGFHNGPHNPDVPVHQNLSLPPHSPVFPESHPVDFFIRSSFKDFTIIRILSTNQMNRSNYKIKGICFCQSVIRFSKMLLKPNLPPILRSSFPLYCSFRRLSCPKYSSRSN